MNGKFFKQLVEKSTGYWIYKARMLPIGSDLKIDITGKARYSKVETVFDVGANHGQTYSRFRRDFPGAHIYSFEPVAEAFTRLSEVAGRDARATLENIAMGDVVSEKMIRLFDKSPELNSLHDDLMNTAADARIETVKIDTIDNYCERKSIGRIDLLKIDTEGYETQVLRGAIRKLEAGKIAFLLCEVGFTRSNTRNTSLSGLTEFLATLNYGFFGLYDVSHYWAEGISFGNALFVHDSVVRTSGGLGR